MKFNSSPKSFPEIQQVDLLVKIYIYMEKSFLNPKVSVPILFGLQKTAGKRADLACMEMPLGKPVPQSLTRSPVNSVPLPKA